MTRNELFDYLERKYWFERLIGPASKADYLLYHGITIVDTVECDEKFVNMPDFYYYDEGRIWFDYGRVSTYSVKNLEGIEKQIKKLMDDYRKMLKVKKTEDMENKMNKIKEMF